MAGITVTSTINSSPEAIFDQWTDGRRFPVWKPEAARHVEMLTAEPVGLGSRFKGIYKGIGEVEWEIVEYDRPRRVSTLAYTKIGDLRHTIVLEPLNGRTRVTQIGQTTPKGIMKLLGPMIAANIKKGFTRDPGLLERYLERAPTTV